jgi:hypothetical protein
VRISLDCLAECTELALKHRTSSLSHRGELRRALSYEKHTVEPSVVPGELEVRDGEPLHPPPRVALPSTASDIASRYAAIASATTAVISSSRLPNSV